MPEFKRILVPVDFSPASDHALEYALDLAERLGAEVHIAHAYQLPVYALPDGGVMVGPEFVARLSEASQSSLNEMAARHSDRGLTLHKHLVDGPAHLEIERLATDIPADLVVMGTHGRTGVKHFLLGSVAERVVRICPVPVITVRSPESD